MTEPLADGADWQGADLHEIARQLVSHLGPTLVATLTGATDKARVIEWAKPDGPEPPHDAARRLVLAHRVWAQVAAAEGDDITRAWFIGGNPLLGDQEVPLTAILDDRAAEVMVAVRAFLEGRPDV